MIGHWNRFQPIDGWGRLESVEVLRSEPVLVEPPRVGDHELCELVSDLIPVI